MVFVIGNFLAGFLEIASRNKIRDDDAIDQLNHWATTGLLIALSMVAVAKQYVGNPIHCWVPAIYKKKHYQKYSDSYCWIHPMYNIPFEDEIPFQEEDRWYNDVGYYRWVFIVFIIQAFLFKFPNLLWNELKNYSGLNVKKIVSMAWDTSMLTQDKRDEKMGHIAIFIDRWLKTYSQYRYGSVTQFRDRFSTVMFCFGKRSGKYLSGLYMFTKILYFANIFCQFEILSSFLDLDFWRYGIDALTVWRKQGKWQDLYNFPRIGLCDYKVRQLQNVQTNSVQCVLAINLFLEKMYLIFWFWLMFLLIMNSLNLIQWIMRGILPHQSETFMKKYLLLLGIDSKREKKLFIKFIHNYLKTDGMFMLRIVASNTSEILTCDLIKHLWKNFKDVHGMGDDGGNPPNGAGVYPDGYPNKESLYPRRPSAPAMEDEDEIPPKHID